MADLPGSQPGGKGFWPDWLTPRRAWELARSIVGLQQTVERLERENRALREDVAELRKSLTEHDAQLKLLTTFVRDSLSNRLEARIEKLAAEILTRRKGG